MNIPKLVKEFSQDVPNSKIKFKIHFNNSNLKKCPEDSDKKQYTLNLKDVIKDKTATPTLSKIKYLDDNNEKPITDMVFDIDFSEGYTLTQIGEEYKPTVLFTLKDCYGVVLFAGSFCVRDLP